MRRMQRLVGAMLTVALVFVLIHTPAVTAQKGTITCQSYNGDYNYCYANTLGNVSLKQQLSNTGCQKGKSWGFDNHGIWVDRGCRAEFEYGRDQGGSSSGSKTAIAASAIGGAIALGMIISSRKDKQDYDKLSADDKVAYNAGWALGMQDARDKKSNDYKRHRGRYSASRESAFKLGYTEGYENTQAKVST